MEKTTKYFSLQVSKHEEIYEKLKSIDVVSQKDTSLFIHNIIDQICGKIVSFHHFSKLQSIEQLIDVYTLFVKNVVGRELKKENIIEDLKTANVNEQYITSISDCIISRFQDIKKELTDKLSKISSSSLSDFDWKMNVILASDRINVVQENVLLLNLTIDNHTQKKEQVMLELTKKELDQLLETFDNINQVVQSYKV
eukprot:gene525-663_t